MKRKIKTINYDGTVIEVEVNVNIYNYDKENYWKENWKNRKSKQEDSLEQLCSYYEKNGLPLELQEESSEITYLRNVEYKELHKAINRLPKTQKRRIILRYFHGLTIPEISKIDGISIKAVEKSLTIAKKSIEKNVKKFFQK